MKKPMFLALAATLLFAFAGLADDVEEQHEVRIVVAGAAADGDFHWTSDGSDLDLENMQVGETRSIVDESGRTVLVTKEADGLSFNIDGKDVRVPDVDAYHMGVAIVDGSDMASAVDVEVFADHDMDTTGGSLAIPVRAHEPDGVTIICKEPLDASVRESIKSVLLSAGRDDKVTFIDASGDGRHVRGVRKRVEVEQ